MFYVVQLPMSPKPNDFHVWNQSELDLCCGDVKVIWKNEDANECYKYIKEEAWSDFYYNGFFSEIFPSIDEVDMCYIQQAFEDGYDDNGSDYFWPKYENDDRKFGEGVNSFGQPDYVTLAQAYTAGSNYKTQGFPK